MRAAPWRRAYACLRVRRAVRCGGCRGPCAESGFCVPALSQQRVCRFCLEAPGCVHSVRSCHIEAAVEAVLQLHASVLHARAEPRSAELPPAHHVFSSEAHGFSACSLGSALVGGGGPALLLLEAADGWRGGILTSAPWRGPRPSLYEVGAFQLLFTVAPTVHAVVAPKSWGMLSCDETLALCSRADAAKFEGVLLDDMLDSVHFPDSLWAFDSGVAGSAVAAAQPPRSLVRQITHVDAWVWGRNVVVKKKEQKAECQH